MSLLNTCVTDRWVSTQKLAIGTVSKFVSELLAAHDFSDGVPWFDAGVKNLLAELLRRLSMHIIKYIPRLKFNDVLQRDCTCFYLHVDGLLLCYLPWV